jgi:ethanolamine ammonia-lyase large subunit
MALADTPLYAFLKEEIIPYDSDSVTRLICDTRDAAVRSLTVASSATGFFWMKQPLRTFLTSIV